MRPSFTPNDFTNCTSVNSNRVRNRLMRVSSVSTQPNGSHDAWSDLCCVMGLSSWYSVFTARLGTKCVTAVIKSLNESLSTLRARFFNLGWLVSIGRNGMYGNMGCVLQHFKVFNSIVSLIAVSVVHVFIRHEGSADVVRHYHAVFEYVSAFSRVWVFRSIDECVPRCGHGLSPIPSRVVFSSIGMARKKTHGIALVDPASRGFARNELLTATTPARYRNSRLYHKSFLVIRKTYLPVEM